MSIAILQGDCREVLKTIASDSIDCVVTSPPYWGLRDYGTGHWEGGDLLCDHRESSAERTAASIASSQLQGGKDGMHRSHLFKAECGKCGAHRVDAQMGLERTLGEHVEAMVSVFREVRRILKPTGTLWLNYGDSYATAPNGRSAADTKAVGNDDRTFRDKPFSTVGPIYDPDGARPGGGVRGSNKGNTSGTISGRIAAGGILKPKDLCGIPWRVAFALQEDGWWLRQDIIWSKPNPMPESAKDRCTKSHEYIFLLTKSQRYWYDQEAIKEQATSDEDANTFRGGSYTEGDVGPRKKIGNRKRGVPPRHSAYASSDRSSLDDVGRGGLRNKRSVWTVATVPSGDAHFATFPPSLIEPCIKAGCPLGGTVLDPFGGTGTVGLVADRLGRNSLLIELSGRHAASASARIRRDSPLFAEITSEAAE